MKLKIFKKKIETVLFKRICDDKNYIVFSSSIKNNLLSSNFYNILNYSLKYSLQKTLGKPLINNFLKSSFFSNTNDFYLFIKNLKINANLIYFIKIKNLYVFNFDLKVQKIFDNFNTNAYVFVSHLQQLLLNWIPLLKLVIKDFSK
jgi:hypothetical protein